MLSGEDHNVSDKYGAWGEKKAYGKVGMGIIRSINEDFIVEKVYPRVLPEGHADEILNFLRKLK